MGAMFWLAGFLILLVIEASTWGLTTIWFAFGALSAFAVAIAGGAVALQIAVALAVSFVLLIFTRPLAVCYLNGRTTKTNVESAIGGRARVESRIDNRLSEGQAVLDGQLWTARSVSDEVTFEPGEMVRVVRVSGVKLIVEKE